VENNIFNLWTYFVIYSICGWILESIFRSFCEKKLINSGFLNGPFCPIYGIGAIIIFPFLKRFVGNIIVLFLVSFIVLSILEYLVGVGLEKIFKTKYWDYSDLKFNIQGRVCLKNSIFWGVLGVLFIEYIHPFIEKQVLAIPSNILIYVSIIIYLALIVDTIISIISTVKLDSALQKVNELTQSIKATLDEIKVITKNNSVKTDNIEKLIHELKIKEARLKLKLYRKARRLKRAFPTMKSEGITKILNQKIDIEALKNKIKKDK
jgi:uncharacterized membrane protein